MSLNDRILLSMRPGAAYSFLEIHAAILAKNEVRIRKTLASMIDAGDIRREKRGLHTVYVRVGEEHGETNQEIVPPRRVDLLNRKPWRPDGKYEWNHARARESRNVQINRREETK